MTNCQFSIRRRRSWVVTRPGVPAHPRLKVSSRWATINSFHRGNLRISSKDNHSHLKEICPFLEPQKGTYPNISNFSKYMSGRPSSSRSTRSLLYSYLYMQTASCAIWSARTLHVTQNVLKLKRSRIWTRRNIRRTRNFINHLKKEV